MLRCLPLALMFHIVQISTWARADCLPLVNRTIHEGAIPPPGDLLDLQRTLWGLHASAQDDQAGRLEGELKSFLVRAKLVSQAGHAKNHAIYRVGDRSFVVFRTYSGAREIVTYELNEELGRPLQIPVTADNPGEKEPGVAQIWVSHEPRSRSAHGEDFVRLEKEIQRDGDVFMMAFLSLDPDWNASNVRRDVERGKFYFDFGNAYADGDRSLMEFFREGRQCLGIRRPPSTYSELHSLLKEKAGLAKFDWHKALDRLNEEKILSVAKERLGQIAAEQFRGRICILRDFFSGLDISKCETTNFRL